MDKKSKNLNDMWYLLNNKVAFIVKKNNVGHYSNIFFFQKSTYDKKTQ